MRITEWKAFIRRSFPSVSQIYFSFAEVVAILEGRLVSTETQDSLGESLQSVGGQAPSGRQLSVRSKLEDKTSKQKNSSNEVKKDKSQSAVGMSSKQTIQTKTNKTLDINKTKSKQGSSGATNTDQANQSLS